MPLTIVNTSNARDIDVLFSESLLDQADKNEE